MDVEATCTTTTSTTTTSAEVTVPKVTKYDLDANGNVVPRHNISCPLIDDKKNPASALKRLEKDIADTAAPPFDPEADKPPPLPEGHVPIPHYPGVKCATINQLSTTGGFATNIVVRQYADEIPMVMQQIETNSFITNIVCDYLNTSNFTVFQNGNTYLIKAGYKNENGEDYTENFSLSMDLHKYDSQPLPNIPADLAIHYGVSRDGTAFIDEFAGHTDENDNPVMIRREVPVAFDVRGLHITELNYANISIVLFANSAFDTVNRGMGVPFAKSRRILKLGGKKYDVPDMVHLPPGFLKVSQMWVKEKTTPVKNECSFEEFLQMVPYGSAVLAYVLTGKF